MINGIQKYLMIALSAVFLWGTSGKLLAQELEKTFLPMQRMELLFKGSNYLLTSHHASEMDIITHHMRSKPEMRITIKHSLCQERRLVEARVNMLKAYLKDSGISTNRIIFSEDEAFVTKNCHGGSISISETAD